MNETEDMLVYNYKLYSKENMLDVISLDDYKAIGTITNETLLIERIKFQIDFNTILHFIALDYEVLCPVLEYMEWAMPDHLNCILIPNKHGKSALDITIENQSPKNSEALLLKLLKFGDQKLSHLIRKKFTALLGMNIKAFHVYLNS